jgi:hypothetical protein
MGENNIIVFSPGLFVTEESHSAFVIFLYVLQQVQLYYAGKSRYIGVFDTKIDAAVAYELARDCHNAFKDDDPSPEQAKKNVMLMRKAAFAPFQACQIENGKRKYSKKAKVEDDDKSSKNQTADNDKAVFDLDEWGASNIVKKSDDINVQTSLLVSAEPTSRLSLRRSVEEHEGKDEIAAPTIPATSSLAHVAADEEAHEIEQVFSSSDTEFSSDMARQTVFSNAEVGDFGVGFKFRKNLIDDSGTDLGWFEGEVVDILTDTGE